MQAFLNDNIKDKLCGGCECTGFQPALNYTYNAGTKTVTVTDASTYPSGDDRKIVHFSIFDKKGHKVLSNIPGNDVDDAVAASVAALDPSEGLDILATVVTNKGCISDGHASNLGASGALGSWDKDNDALTIPSPAGS